VPDHPEDPGRDPLALRLKDSGHWSLGGAHHQNHEAHYAGATVGDTTKLREIQPERDAQAFERRAMARTFTLTWVSNRLDCAMVDAPTGPRRVKAGSELPNAIRVRVMGRFGFEEPLENTEHASSPEGIEGIVVELEVSPEGGIVLVPRDTAEGYRNGSRYVAVTGHDGVAAIDVTGLAPGTYTVSIVVTKLVPDGNVPGEPLLEESVTVEVEP
jgi:hypothetical protein